MTFIEEQHCIQLNNIYNNIQPLIINNYKINIYCSFHNYIDIKNILDKKYLIPYYTKFIFNNNIIHINQLQKFFCEYVLMYYVWKNIKNLDFIGFCHYKKFRQFKYNDISCENNLIICQNIEHNIINNLFSMICCNFLYNDLLEYINNNYTKNSYEYNLYINNIEKKILWIQSNCFITQFSIFINLMYFIDNYIKFVFKKYNINNSEESLNNFIKNNWVNTTENISPDIYYWFGNKKNPIEFNNQYRIFAYIIEFLAGSYLANYPEITIKNLQYFTNKK